MLKANVGTRVWVHPRPIPAYHFQHSHATVQLKLKNPNNNSKNINRTFLPVTRRADLKIVFVFKALYCSATWSFGFTFCLRYFSRCPNQCFSCYWILTLFIYKPSSDKVGTMRKIKTECKEFYFHFKMWQLLIFSVFVLFVLPVIKSLQRFTLMNIILKLFHHL